MQLRADAFNALNHPDVCESGRELDEHELWPGDGDGGFNARVLQFAATVSF